MTLLEISVLHQQGTAYYHFMCLLKECTTQ
jgi:hypothetical protein